MWNVRLLLDRNASLLILFFIFCVSRDQSDVQVKLEELEITNKRLLEDNFKLKTHVRAMYIVYASLYIWSRKILKQISV